MKTKKGRIVKYKPKNKTLPYTAKMQDFIEAVALNDKMNKWYNKEEPDAECEHNNKIMVDYSFYMGVHDTTWECVDCGHTFKTQDTPKLYNYYNTSMVIFNGTLMHEEHKKILLKKKKQIEARKAVD